MRFWSVLLLAVASACVDFDELGEEARCRAEPASCDGGVSGTDAGASDAGVSDGGTTDAGALDAGEPDAGDPDAGDPDAGTTDAGDPVDAGDADAGTPDAGTPDAGVIDAGSPGLYLPLVVDRSFSEGLDTTKEVRGPGAVVAGDAGRVLLFVETVSINTAQNLPPGYPHGYVVLIDPVQGGWVQFDGGVTNRTAQSALRYVGSKRSPVAVRDGLAMYTQNERLTDGGRPGFLDGGFPDAGYVQYATKDSFFSVSLDVLTAAYLGETSDTPLAASQIFRNGVLRDAYVATNGTVSTLVLPARAGLSAETSTSIIPCGAPALDAVVTTFGAEDRLVTLTRCTAGSNLSVAAYGFSSTPLLLVDNGVESARMAIASQGVPLRAPFVAWSTSTGVHLARLQRDATDFDLRVTVTEPMSTARVAALAIDDTNGPIVVLELPNITADVRLEGLAQTLRETDSRMAIAAFDENLRLRWAGPLRSTQRLTSNSAAYASGRLVLEVQCPEATTAMPLGAPCGSTAASTLVTLRLPDGGSP